MPAFLESKLKKEYPGDKAAPFKVMNSIGAMRGNVETPLGREMEAKHNAKKPKTSGLAKMRDTDKDGM